MAEFKSFIFKEDMGLGDIGQSVDRLFNNKHFSGTAGAYVNTDYSEPSPEGHVGDSDFLPRLPATNLTIPSIQREGRITVLLAKKNPIFVKLTDGTEAYFSYDEFKRIKGSEPSLGKTMRITFQRHPNDLNASHSKIDHVEVVD